jgi:signal transduction histidine kinase
MAKGVRLEARPIDPGIKVQLATAEFLRVLHNLLENALRHTPDGGRVALEAKYSSDEVVLMVSDGCGGIPPGDIERLFEAGFRGDIARTPWSGAATGAQAGLGLAIAQGLAEAHGGRIVARNEGAGCCFCFHLPLRALASRPVTP